MEWPGRQEMFSPLPDFKKLDQDLEGLEREIADRERARADGDDTDATALAELLDLYKQKVRRGNDDCVAIPRPTQVALLRPFAG